jgi:hypothetical protein
VIPEESLSTYETDQPWVVYRYGLTHDGWWPLWRSTRVLGRMKIVCECAICGDRTTLALRIPRFGTIKPPKGGKHVARLRYLMAHVHRDRPSPMAWARPLLNMAAHPGGLDLDALAMRLEADLRDAERHDA